jgi:hypothetical protein
MSLVGRRIRSQANLQSSRQSSQKVYAGACFPSLHSVGLPCSAMCGWQLSLFQTPTPHQRKAQNPLLAVKQMILRLVYVGMRYSHV